MPEVELLTTETINAGDEIFVDFGAGGSKVFIGAG